MLTDATLEQGIGMIGNAKLVLMETLIPSQHTNNGNSPYRPEYEWLFIYERKLAGFLEPWMSHLRRTLIGDNGILSEALSNAFCHGHKKNPRLPIDIAVYLGRQGLIIRVKDTGPGFDIKTVINRYQKGETYFHMAGNGLHQMNQSDDFHIFFTDSGSCFNLLYLFDKSIH